MANKMPFNHDQDRIVVSHVTSTRPSGRGEGPLMKNGGENMETHGPLSGRAPYGIDLNKFVEDFNTGVLAAYGKGGGDYLPADASAARSLVPPGTGVLRDFSHIAPEFPVFDAANCVACMECVNTCPDTAILGKVAVPEVVEKAAADSADATARSEFQAYWVKTTKFFTVPEKKGRAGGLFTIYIDPAKCKGCGECVVVCGDHQALHMADKEPLLESYRDHTRKMRSMPETPADFLERSLPLDFMLKEERALLYVGGAGSCAGCGEASAIRMMLASTGERYEAWDIGIVAATGCNTVYGSTYPYNPYRVTWSNSLFENAPAVAMGVRAHWDQQGQQDKRLWVIGGDGAMYDIGFQALSRMLASGMDIKVLVLDTQVYSNTGGQASTSTFPGQSAKMAPHGRVVPGKEERRKELSNIAMMHPDVYVAQTATVFFNHFYQAIREANAYPGPALINVYTTCQPEHGVADDMSQTQARRAVESRAFPLFIHDPRKGDRLSERLNLRGNPNPTEDWRQDPKTKVPYEFVDFARSEGRFAKQFSADGSPSAAIMAAQDDRLKNWRLLRELAGQKIQ